jgi:hypothetical protein
MQQVPLRGVNDRDLLEHGDAFDCRHQDLTRQVRIALDPDGIHEWQSDLPRLDEKTKRLSECEVGEMAKTFPSKSERHLGLTHTEGHWHLPTPA